MGHADIQIFLQKLIQFCVAIGDGHGKGLAILSVAGNLSGIIIIDNVHVLDLSGLHTLDQFIVMAIIGRFRHVLLLHSAAKAQKGDCSQHDQDVDRQIFKRFIQMYALLPIQLSLATTALSEHHIHIAVILSNHIIKQRIFQLVS